MGVDGFRFDLASTLGRPRGGGFDPAAPLLTDITSDPVLSTVKLIAEPWDATGEGYQVGGFGPAWAEWNGRFRDDVRDFWRGHGPLSEIVTRVAGSSDLYWPARTPAASVNFVTAHDGFTLADLVSYERKHNEANGEQGRDGTDDNRSRQPRRRGADVRPGDPGAAGPAGAQPAHHAAALGGHPDAAGRRRARPHPARQQQRLLRWTTRPPGARGTRPELVDFVARALSLRRATPALRRTDFFYGREDTDPDDAAPDIAWLHPDGREFTEPDFHAHGRTLVVRVDGGALAAAGAPRRRRPRRRPPARRLRRRRLDPGARRRHARRRPARDRPPARRASSSPSRPTRPWCCGRRRPEHDSRWRATVR